MWGRGRRGRYGGVTIFWPPGPLPLRKASSRSASLTVGRGGIALAAVAAEARNHLREWWRRDCEAHSDGRRAVNIAGSSSEGEPYALICVRREEVDRHVRPLNGSEWWEGKARFMIAGFCRTSLQTITYIPPIFHVLAPQLKPSQSAHAHLHCQHPYIRVEHLPPTERPTTSDHRPRLPPPVPPNTQTMFYTTTLLRWLQRKRYQYEVTFSLYMLTPTEKIIFSTPNPPAPPLPFPPAAPGPLANHINSPHSNTNRLLSLPLPFDDHHCRFAVSARAHHDDRE